ncbi:CsbD-like protein [Lacrimispora xylanisolvens]|uniref:CsbD-like protein n=1 Tax=Lacrimispora xylanisolvens TaxID=384636 RepID=A0A2S6HVN1_9FIRM|nr:CsbD family protein [Hungatella xylanolytica]MBE5989736.1 CsbD family protein [Paenibacillaceae bacterium]PPK81935.1 CsbD-like protein [Hungatella xylanolytica]
MNDSIKSKTDKVVGTIKENIGKAMDSEQMELSGKLQNLAGEARGKVEETMGKSVQISEDIKESIADKANDLIDSVRRKN